MISKWIITPISPMYKQVKQPQPQPFRSIPRHPKQNVPTEACTEVDVTRASGWLQVLRKNGRQISPKSFQAQASPRLEKFAIFMIWSVVFVDQRFFGGGLKKGAGCKSQLVNEQLILLIECGGGDFLSFFREITSQVWHNFSVGDGLLFDDVPWSRSGFYPRCNHKQQMSMVLSKWMK